MNDHGRTTTGPMAADVDEPTPRAAGEPPLGRVLAHPHRSGENVRGQLTGAAWTWLLPDPVPARILVLGSVPEPVLRSLGAAGTQVRLARTDGSDGAAPTGPGPVDVVWFAPDATPVERAILDGPSTAWRSKLLVVEHPSGPNRSPGAVPSADDSGPGRSIRYRVRPGLAGLRSAVPEADPTAETMLAERGLLPAGGRATRRRWLAVRSAGAARWRTAELRIPDATDEPAGGSLEPPPAWLRRIAAERGFDLDGWRFAFAAPGVYNTQKLLAFLAPPADDDATIVVKATRDEAAGERLDNERDGLEQLASLGPLTVGRTPRVRFAGSISGRVVVGEEVMPGRTLRAMGVHSAGHPLIDDAIDFLAGLAQATAEPRAAVELAGALADLVSRWAELTAPEPSLRRRVDADVERLARAIDPIPTINQHGDPGIWNLVAPPGGPVAFLDWENFEPAGLPGWDVAYLLRSAIAGSTGRWQRARDRLVGGRARAVAARFERAARPSGPAATALERYASQVGVERPIVATLIRMGWVYQALKEATRLPVGAGSRAAHQEMLRIAGWSPDDRGGGER